MGPSAHLTKLFKSINTIHSSAKTDHIFILGKIIEIDSIKFNLVNQMLVVLNIESMFKQVHN